MFHRIHHPAAIAAGSTLTITGDEFHHAARVARVRAGERIELFDGAGNAAEGVVGEVGRDSLSVHVEKSLPSRESTLDLTLAMSIIQLERFELVLQKATELGTRTLIPVVADRGEVRPERYRGKNERWEKIVLEAVKQSGRSVIPNVEAPMPLDGVIARGGEILFCDADESPSELPASLLRVTLCIGPEGGWSEREISIAREAKCRTFRMGPRRLR
ncbi:MAG TPA: RsmE family RNA methyltransferase, partial [Thermoanaerobaculia bacterium]